MKILSIILTWLLVQSSSWATEKHFRSQEQIEHKFSKRLRIQQERVEKLSEFVSWTRENIERQYVSGIDRLKQSAERQAFKISLKQRLLWMEFWRMHSQKPYPDGYFRNPRIKYWKKQDRLRRTMQESYFLRSFRDLLLNEDFGKLLTQMVYGHAKDPLRPEARKLLPVVQNLQLQARILDRSRKGRLAQLDEWQKNVTNNAHKTALEIKTEAERFQFGVVSAISHSSNGSFCVIKGVDETLSVGDRIGETRISRILEEKVEFDKDGKKWTQTLGAPPGPEW